MVPTTILYEHFKAISFGSLRLKEVESATGEPLLFHLQFFPIGSDGNFIIYLNFKIGEFGDSKTIEFDDCLPFDAIPSGAVDVRSFLKGNEQLGDASTAFSDIIAALVMPNAKLLVKPGTVGNSEEGNMVFELGIVGPVPFFYTSATCPLTELIPWFKYEEKDGLEKIDEEEGEESAAD